MNARSAEKQAAFEARLEAHKGIVFKIAGAYSRTPAERDDLAQEIALQLWRSFDSFDGRSAFSTWMYRVALNTAISHARRETIYRSRVATGTPMPEPAIPPQTGDEKALLLRELIAQLDPLNRALMLLYLDDHSYETIASILGISTTNVATKISRIKTKLRSLAANRSVLE